MRVDRNTSARWLFSGLFAAVAVWLIVETVVSLVRSRGEGWGAILFLCCVTFAFATPFAIAAYLCFKRRYAELFMVWAAVAAFFLVALCFAVPQRLGVFAAAPRWQAGAPWRVPVMLVLSVLLGVGPFYVAGAFLGACWRFAGRRLPNGKPSHP
jgi:hypothetical protein